MSRILKLTPLLANQIAAGEVIERPLSVVKELLENSMDAGAKQIDIEIENGGLKLIKVKDDGHGIHKDDLPLAVKRHTTSKIKTSDDLAKITSLGFRGEALASISSVSRFSLISAQEKLSSDNSTGWSIFIEGDIQGELIPAAHPRGTTAEVADLFFNLPARRKFLRSEKTEFTHIDELVKRLALSSLHIGFTLKHNQKVLRRYFPIDENNQVQGRLAALCGEEFVENMLQIEVEGAGMQLMGWIAAPTFTRSQTDLQYVYVNGRMVKDKLILHAVKQAYHDVLYRDRHPAFILFLEISPFQVDVNVHPAKHEVRFRDSRLVHDFLVRSIKDALSHAEPDHKCAISLPTIIPPAIAPQDTPQFAKPQFAQFDSKSSGSYYPSSRLSQSQPIHHVQEKMAIYKSLHTADEKIPHQPQHDHTHESEHLGYAIGQLKGIYIVAENTEGLVLIDMHAAHERVIYEKMKVGLANQSMQVQQLLDPITINITDGEMEIFTLHQAHFLELGLNAEIIAQNCIALRSAPVWLASGPVAQLFRDILSDLTVQGKSSRAEDTRNFLLGNIACKSAICARTHLTIPEMNALLRQMETTPHAGQCNHGRPTCIKLPLPELDKLFLRGR